MSVCKEVGYATLSNGWVVRGCVYQVRAMQKKHGIASTAPPDWYEYKVALLDKNGEVIDMWDSIEETYNGVQKLTKQEAIDAVKDIIRDCKEDVHNCKGWFKIRR